jgi:hypothetical protein
MKVEGIFTGRANECSVFHKTMRSLLGIGPRDALSIETCWTPELAVNVLI